MKLPQSFGKPKRRPSLLLIRRVVGDSMLPGLHADQLVVGVRPQNLRPGEIVIVIHNGLEKIKRIQQISKDRLFLVGDNQERSRDSHSFGWLPISVVRAKVLWPRETGARRAIKTV